MAHVGGGCCCTVSIPHRLYRAADPEMRAIASPGVLSQWRFHGRGPVYLKVAGKVFYAGQDLIAWLDANRVVPRVGAPQPQAA